MRQILANYKNLEVGKKHPDFLSLKSLGLLTILFVLSLGLSACGGAGSESKTQTIGVYIDNALYASRFDGLKEGLKALGLTEGKEVRYEVVNAANLSQEQRTAAIKDFVAKNYDLYWLTSGPAADSFKQAGLTKPVVIGGVADAVTRGLAQSKEKPGGNVTGIDSINTELTVSRLEWLVRLDPTIQKVYLLYNPKNTSQMSYLPKIQQEAQRLKLTLIEKQTVSQNMEKAKELLATLKGSEAQAIVGIGNGPISMDMEPATLKATVEREKLILIGSESTHLEIGALFTYGANNYNLGRQSAGLVSKVLSGVNPGEIPIVSAEKLDLLLNQRMADMLGRKFPETMVKSAAEVVNK